MILLFCFSFSLKAQQILFASNHRLFFGSRNFAPANRSMMLSHNNALQKQPATIPLGFLNDLPFFCAMECKVRKHTKIWIKLRAGDDDSYMKMIGQ